MFNRNPCDCGLALPSDMGLCAPCANELKRNFAKAVERIQELETQVGTVANELRQAQSLLKRVLEIPKLDDTPPHVEADCCS